MFKKHKISIYEEMQRRQMTGPADLTIHFKAGIERKPKIRCPNSLENDNKGGPTRIWLQSHDWYNLWLEHCLESFLTPA